MKKLNKISWASGPNLCQVKHFLEEDSPSEVGRGSQHHLQFNRTHPSIIRRQCLKQSKERHPSIIGSSSEGRQCLKQSKERLSYRSPAKWKCPPKFNLNEKWRVVAGEESKEAEDQEHREKRVLEAVYPSRSAIPPNPYTLLDLEQYYDDNQTPVIRIIPIEEAADVEAPFHLTPSQIISSKSPDACLPNSSSSSVSIGTSPNLPANGKSVPQPLSTFQNPGKPPSNSLFCVRWPSNVQSAPPYLSSCQNLKGSSQTQVSPKPPVSYNSLSQDGSTFKNRSTPDQTEFFPDKPANHSTPDQTQIFPDQPANYSTLDQTEIYPNQPANQNHAPKYRTICENQNISHQKSQVSGMPPANHNPEPPSNSPFSVRWPSDVQSAPPYLSRCQNLKGSSQTQVSPKSPVSYSSLPQDRSTFKNLSTPDQTEFFPDKPANHSSPDQIQNFRDQPANQNHTPKYRIVCENQNISQQKSQVSGMPPANHNPVTQFPSTCENPNMTVAVAVAALAKAQEQGSLIDGDLLVKLLLNPDEIPKLMSERRTAIDPKPDKVINKSINEYQASHAGSGPIFVPKPMAKSVPLTMTKPETSVKSNLANEQGAPHVGTTNKRVCKPLVHPTSSLNLEKVKKLINKYGAPDNVGGKPLFNSDLVSSSFSKGDAVLSRADLPTTLQPELQISPLSPNAGRTLPFSSMTGPTPLHKDINYCKSLIKEHGENREPVVDERLQNKNPRGATRGPGLLNNRIPNQRSLDFRKPCMYFNKPGGCFNGSSCPFVHDMSGQRRPGEMLEDRDSKRMK